MVGVGESERICSFAPIHGCVRDARSPSLCHWKKAACGDTAFWQGSLVPGSSTALLKWYFMGIKMVNV